MFIYEKALQYPVRIRTPNARYASIIISELGGPDGEINAATRYLTQRFSMPYREIVGLLTDIGAEELGHVEMICAILRGLTKGITTDEVVSGGLAPYFVDHTVGTFPTAASGFPQTTASIGVKGDLFADLCEDVAAEQKARVTYDNILRLIDDPDVCDPIRFLREREVVHAQRFGEALTLAQERTDERNFYGYNPSFDRAQGGEVRTVRP